MKLVSVPFEELVLGERHRKVYLEIEELAQSIMQNGLLQPLIINAKNQILVGGRRYHAFKHIKSLGALTYDIPCVMYEGNSKTDQLCIELLENIQRSDFTWTEQITLVERVHMALLAEEGPTWTIEQTGDRLGMSKSAVSKDLKLANALKMQPAIASAETKAKANFMIQNSMRRLESVSNVAALSDSDMEKLRAIVNCQSAKCGAAPELNELQLDDMCSMGEENARLVGLSGTPLTNPLVDATRPVDARKPETQGKIGENPTDPLEAPFRVVGGGQTVCPEEVVKAIPSMSYHIKSYKELLLEIPDNSVGLIEIDPPYAIEFDKTYGKAQGLTSTLEDWDVGTFKDNMAELLEHSYRMLIPNSWCLVWTAYEHLAWLEKQAKKQNFNLQRPGVWVKPGGSSNHPKKRLISNVEFYLLLGKGDPTFMTSMLLQGIYQKTSNAVEKIHTTEKPVALYDELFAALSRPSSLFFAPFAGSGNSMIAAAKRNMAGVGCDVNPQYKVFFEGKIVKEFFNGK